MAILTVATFWYLCYNSENNYDMEDIYIEYEKTKEKIHYEIEKTREVMKVQFARGFLGTMNALALIGLIGVLCFYLSLIGDIS